MIDRLEPRRLFTLAALDPSFGDGGAVIDASQPKVPDADYDLAVQRVLALPNGRHAQVLTTAIVYYTADGELDTSRGVNGRVTANLYRFRDAESAADGSIVAISNTYDESDGYSDFEVLRLDSAGQYIFRTFAGDQAGYYSQIAPGPGGTTLLVHRNPAVGVSTGFVSTRLDAAGEIDTSYGNNGRQVVAVAGMDELKDLRIDGSSRAYVFFDTFTLVSANLERREVQAVRLESSGSVSAGWGAGGQLTLLAGDTPYGGPWNYPALDDVEVTPDGTIAAMTSVFINPSDAPQLSTISLVTFDRNGGNRRAVELATSHYDERLRSAAQLDVADDGTTWVVLAPDRTVAQIYKLTGTTLDTTYGSFGPFASTTTAISLRDTAVINGRLLVAGSTREAHKREIAATTLAINATTEILGVAAKRSVVFGDGTLAVRGTGGHDVIDISSRRGLVRIRVNGKLRQLPLNLVRGIYIETGGGNDRVTIADWITAGAYVLAGDGDDFVQASSAASTLVGGAGDDTLLGAVGNDNLYGQSGDDSLVGSLGIDRLYGGAGVDTLAGRLPAGIDDRRHDGSDSLYSGAGADVIYRNDENVSPEDRDELFLDSLDRIIG